MSFLMLFCLLTTLVMIFSVVHDPVISAAELNHDLNLINKWAYQWKMAFNPDPSKQAVKFLFSQKKNEVYHPPLLQWCSCH